MKAAWSFEVGYITPDSRICVGMPSSRPAGRERIDDLVGDTSDADYQGTRASGLRAVPSDRTGVFGQHLHGRTLSMICKPPTSRQLAYFLWVRT